MKYPILLLTLMLSACSVSNPLYRMDINQGNVVTQEMIARLKPGMTRAQVKFVMGTPMISDMFHGNRWDYPYYLRKAGELAEERRISLFFEGEKLQRIEGDVAAASPAELEKMARPSGVEDAPKKLEPKPADGEKKDGETADAPKPEEAPKPARAKPEEKGFFGKMLEKVGF